MSEEKEIYNRLIIDRVSNGFIVFAQESENITSQSAKPYVCSEDELTHLVCKLFFHGGKL